MLAGLRRRLTFANVVSVIALFIALGGGAYAAVALPKNSVGTKQLKKNAVTSAKIGKNAVTGAKVKDGSLSGLDINLATLPKVGSAATADNATHAGAADNATNAGHATNADHATNTDKATAADSATSATTATTAKSPGTLPSGTTETGAFSFGCTGAASSDCAEGESFAFPLSQASVPATVIPAAGPATANCPGSASNPTAGSGNLCVYVAGTFGPLGTIGVFDPGSASPDFGQANQHGFGIFGATTATGAAIAWGTWAVTG